MGGRLRAQRHMAMTGDVARDADGHLAASQTWSEAVAETLAAQAGITLEADHWRVIRAVRGFHAETGVVPSMRPLVKLLKASAPDLASSLALLRLFPGSPARLVAQVAGLPRPDACL